MGPCMEHWRQSVCMCWQSLDRWYLSMLFARMVRYGIVPNRSISTNVRNRDPFSLRVPENQMKIRFQLVATTFWGAIKDYNYVMNSQWLNELLKRNYQWRLNLPLRFFLLKTIHTFYFHQTNRLKCNFLGKFAKIRRKTYLVKQILLLCTVWQSMLEGAVKNSTSHAHCFMRKFTRRRSCHWRFFSDCLPIRNVNSITKKAKHFSSDYRLFFFDKNFIENKSINRFRSFKSISDSIETMSTRWYPIYKRGNPQLRVFMTDFWMKMVRNDVKPTPPANVVTFHCSMEMTSHDIKNYLTKIYNIPVVNVKTEVRLGEFFRDPFKRYVKKKDDYRVAIVTMVRTLTEKYNNIKLWMLILVSVPSQRT